MGSWQLDVQYQAWLYRLDPATRAVRAAWCLTSLVSLDALNVVTGSVAQATATFADFDGQIRGVIKPQLMDLFVFRTTSRFSNTFRTIWTGVVDEVHSQLDPKQGTMVQLVCTGPWKYFEVGYQSPQAVQNLALAYIKGVSASAVLRYVAGQVRYPGPLAQLPAAPGLVIDPTVDVGMKTLSLPSGVFTEPDQQSWSAVLQAVINDTGHELFSREDGALLFRPNAYVQRTAPTVIDAVDIVQVDLASTDQNAATEVRVKWAFDYYFTQDGDATAPATMADQLGNRIITYYHPWIQTVQGAGYLAKVLLLMHAANTLVGTLTMLCNPAITVGSLVRVPSFLPGGGQTDYYVNSIQYALNYNQQWYQILSLAYGRAPNQSFPYLGTVHTPQPVIQGGVQGGGGLTVDPNNPNQITTGFTLVKDTSQQSTTITMSADGPPVGTVVQIQDAKGNPLGPSPTGEYTIVALNTAQNTTIGIASTGGATTGYIVIVSYPTNPAPTTGTATNPTPPTTTPITQVGDGSDLPTPSSFSVYPVQPTSVAVITLDFNVPYPGEALVNGVPTHLGIDIASTAGQGTHLVAPCDGVIVKDSYDWGLPPPGLPAPYNDTSKRAPWLGGKNGLGYGNLTILRVGNYDIYFGHKVAPFFTLGPNVVVKAGMLIGLMGATGYVTGVHVHFGMQDRTQISNAYYGFINPNPFLPPKT